MSPLAFILIIGALGSARCDDSLDNYIRAILDNLRDQMPVGLPDLNIPVLDPLRIGDIDVNHQDSKIEINLKIAGLTINKLSKFQIKNLTSDMSSMQFHIVIGFPDLDASASYDLKGKVFKLLPLYGTGPATFIAHDLVIQTTATIEITSEFRLQLTSFSHDISFSGIDLNLQNFLGGGALGDTVNQLISMFGPKIFDANKGKFENALNDIILKEVNGQLKNFDISNLSVYQHRAY